MFRYSKTIMLLAVVFFGQAPLAGSAEVACPPPGIHDTCPVCGMFVAKYPDWVAQVRFKDEKTVFFDGAKDFFKYYFDIGGYRPGKSRADVGSSTARNVCSVLPSNR